MIDYFGQQYPSLALLIAAKSLNLTSKDVKVNLGQNVSVGGKTIRTDDYAQMYTYFYKDRDNRPAFPIDSFFDVYSGKIPASKYADKIVLIGATAAGIGTNQVTPISAADATRGHHAGAFGIERSSQEAFLCHADLGASWVEKLVLPASWSPST